ncbi:MAG TPA: L-seryl-tRNA(Sec) selenium transferase [Gemmataceae bacterium]|jgi:L-seryl-tRNA(Ser) seleniumtransferase|nr:L-seryl-tRNA(Sec) selenium transferase [Gemmataceae bacterium]
MSANHYRHLPSVNEVLETAPVQSLLATHAHEVVVDSIREELAQLREQIGAGAALDGEANLAALAQRVADRVSREQRPNLRPVINATGIVLHTNLGRAPVAEEAAQAAYEAARGYLNLEFDLASGQRSSRQIAIRNWLCRLTGAESATAVNNCAAATVIVLRTLAAGKEAIVSRGQLIEIGGSFRIPEIMAVSGATLREVGTTNITRIGDYEKAINPNTALLMRVHHSNYRVIGFTESASLEELVALSRKHNLPVVDDVGSGQLADLSGLGFQDEPLIRNSITAGADLVLFSGDKLLGGPQAGIILGRKALIQKIERDPLMRAFRLDKMTLAALEATLRLYLDEQRAWRDIPVLRMLATPMEELRIRAQGFVKELARIAGIRASVRETETFVGGGSLPAQAMPSIAVAIAIEGQSEAQLAERLRTGTPAVLSRIQDGELLLDLRTIFVHQEKDLLSAVRAARENVV